MKTTQAEITPATIISSRDLLRQIFSTKVIRPGMLLVIGPIAQPERDGLGSNPVNELAISVYPAAR